MLRAHIVAADSQMQTWASHGHTMHRSVCRQAGPRIKLALVAAQAVAGPRTFRESNPVHTKARTWKAGGMMTGERELAWTRLSLPRRVLRGEGEAPSTWKPTTFTGGVASTFFPDVSDRCMAADGARAGPRSPRRLPLEGVLARHGPSGGRVLLQNRLSRS